MACRVGSRSGGASVEVDEMEAGAVDVDDSRI